ncbi:hypothetical protein PVK06_000603 [Gossypium arboreum]|uniref:HAT C-terminal dimerisation domain-containing protein n=1 Tax=Gossypium arboreum TaxID=29729 RepID=A0ABR0R033_GOSAR|nr:hypothetical protein PVK06_000603 [Gossypium arboreum]
MRLKHVTFGIYQVLAKTNKSNIYPFLDKIIRLVVTLPVSNATIKQTFLAMKIVKTRLRNRMKDDFLSIYLVAYIKKERAREFSIDSIIDEYKLMKKRRTCKYGFEPTSKEECGYTKRTFQIMTSYPIGQIRVFHYKHRYNDDERQHRP